jgi:hypothetical protein
MPQNRKLTGFTNWQMGQVIVRLDPHIPQKRISAGFSKSQLGHFIANRMLSKKEALLKGAPHRFW